MNTRDASASKNIFSTCLKQGGDLFYSHYSIVISSHQLASLPSSTSSMLLCSECNKELGEVEEKRESATMWADAILLLDPSSLETVGVPPIQGISTSEDLFTAMVNLKVSQSPELMPKIVVKSRLGSGLLLWVVDKNLRLLKGSQDKVAEEQTVLKVLFKELTMEEDGNSNSVFVPKEVVQLGLKLLEDSIRHFPDSMRSAQGFLIGHISKG